MVRWWHTNPTADGGWLFSSSVFLESATRNQPLEILCERLDFFDCGSLLGRMLKTMVDVVVDKRLLSGGNRSLDSVKLLSKIHTGAVKVDDCVGQYAGSRANPASPSRS
jgi:hypothetical protein